MNSKLYEQLECHVVSCFTCPFCRIVAQSDVMDLRTYGCAATKGCPDDAPKPICTGMGNDAVPRDSAPRWCPLRFGAVLVQWQGGAG